MINNLYYPYLIVCVKTHVATRKQMRFELLLNVETEFSCKPAGFSPKQKSIQNLWITEAFFHFKNLRSKLAIIIAFGIIEYFPKFSIKNHSLFPLYLPKIRDRKS